MIYYVIEASNGKVDWTRRYQRYEGTAKDQSEFRELLDKLYEQWPLIENWEWSDFPIPNSR